MNPHASQYAPPEGLPRVASDPDLVMRMQDGYVVEMLPATGGVGVTELILFIAAFAFSGFVLWIVKGRR